MLALRVPRPLLVLAVLLGVSVLAVAPGFGATANDLSATLACDGFTPNGGSLTADRDNTGSGQEAIAFNAVDGNGTVIFQLIDAVPVGWEVTPASANWTTPPTANPINMSIVSLDGNGLPQETIYQASANCEGLPEGSPADATAITREAPAAPVVLQISPAIPPGQPIPTPTSNAAAIETLPFYAIVNTPRMNLRSGDGPQYLPVGVVRGGERARLLARNDQTSWWLLEIGGVVGWASDEFLAIRGDATGVPFIDGTGVITPVTFVTSIPQRVYSEPNDLNTSFVCEIPPGEWVVASKDRFDVFYQIQTTCTDGRAVTAWLRGEEGLFRNPAALSLPVTRE